jgi:peptidoglycan/xylan/chitin deacetylase (PgdA/CDA1 family)
VDRRRFLVALAAGLTGIAAGRGTSGLAAPFPPVPTPAAPAPPPVPVATVVAHPAGLTPVVPPTGAVSELPGTPAALALTVDDGTSSEVVGAFLQFAEDSGVRLTFFPNGCYSSWRENAPALRALLERGQVALGNHTWSHPDVTTLSDAEVAEEIDRNRRFLQDVFGAGSTPFFRPPFGAHTPRTDRIAAECGHPTIALWNGDLDGGRVVTAEQLVRSATRAFTAGSMVLCHANHPTVTHTYARLLDLLRERQLQTVTLADVWSAPS